MRHIGCSNRYLVVQTCVQCVRRPYVGYGNRIGEVRTRCQIRQRRRFVHVQQRDVRDDVGVHQRRVDDGALCTGSGILKSDRGRRDKRGHWRNLIHLHLVSDGQAVALLDDGYGNSVDRIRHGIGNAVGGEGTGNEARAIRQRVGEYQIHRVGRP